jgi:hypothetical protein
MTLFLYHVEPPFNPVVGFKETSQMIQVIMMENSPSHPYPHAALRALPSPPLMEWLPFTPDSLF